MWVYFLNFDFVIQLQILSALFNIMLKPEIHVFNFRIRDRRPPGVEPVTGARHPVGRRRTLLLHLLRPVLRHRARRGLPGPGTGTGNI